jgi:hypothetical protein
MNLLEGINGSLGTNQNPGDSELNCLKYFFSRVTSRIFLGRVFWVAFFWVAFFESRFLGRVFPVYKNVTQPVLISLIYPISNLSLIERLMRAHVRLTVRLT